MGSVRVSYPRHTTATMATVHGVPCELNELRDLEDERGGVGRVFTKDEREECLKVLNAVFDVWR